MSEQELAELAERAGKTIKWAGFLLGAMLVILLVDLQLKRSIGRQAVMASEAHMRMVSLAEQMRGAAGGRQAVGETPGPGRDPGDAGRGGVDGNASMAAGADNPVGAAKGPGGAAPGGARKRAPGNGRRAGRTAGGS